MGQVKLKLLLRHPLKTIISLWEILSDKKAVVKTDKYFAAYEESDLLFVCQGEVSPGGDGHPAVACIAAAAHDAQMVIVAHAPVTERVHVI